VGKLDKTQLAQTMAGSKMAVRWSHLGELAGEDASRLLQLVCRVSPAKRLIALRDLETGQAERGAGFLGMLPDQIPADLEVPVDLETSLDVALRLAEIRASNLEAIATTMPQYELAFRGCEFELGTPSGMPAGWRLDIDVAGIRAALDFFDSEDRTIEAARAITKMPAFAQMMRHRRELGYVPEPLINEEGLAWCLVRAASDDPVDEIWKWLHPQNLFDLSDLHAHRAQYRDLIDQLSAGGGLAKYVLDTIAPYAPPETVFEDTFSFAVGWGIRGWATEETGGMNIEHVKDNFPAMLPTLIHETFHRLQVIAARPNPEIEGADFDRITSYPFESEGDRRLYRALCYIMLEGSATYVASRTLEEQWIADAKAGLDLLDRLRAIASSDGAEDGSDELLNEGLRSNGPFYGFGALLSYAIVEEDGPASLGLALQAGAPHFFERGVALLESETLVLPDGLGEHVNALSRVLNT
ncbi:hypothetical protein KJ567_01815, partial [Candidatus Bipolaricaulota bacterium]|nr:hypothetical protein [Candidatus Bipolaricaulota bacterium]